MLASPQPPAVLADASMTCPGSQQDALGCAAQRTPSFSTTQTFTTTHGFVVPAAAAAAAPPAALAPFTAAAAAAAEVVASDGDAPAERRQQQLQLQPPVSPTPAAVPGSSSSTPVGWSGLLEISRSSCCPGLVGSAISSWEEELGSQGHIEVACTAHASTGVRRLVKAVIRGLKARQEPEAAREGMGGTYFFTNEAGRKVAIFKPCDEEPLAPANPKGYVGRNLGDPGWKSTVRVGEAAMREVAAYLLDHDHFAQVPHTVLVQAQHGVFNYKYAPTAGAAAAAAPGGGGASSSGGSSTMTVSSSSSMSTASLATEAAADVAAAAAALNGDDGSGSGGGCSSSGRPLKLGSLQEFVYHIADTSDFGASRFRTRDVHAIGILDLRLFNTDRHAGNILVRAAGDAPGPGAYSAGSRTLGLRPPAAAAAAAVAGSEYSLVPIDHGFCLPEALDAPYFEWLHWGQACLPFDGEELAYIAALDPAADIALLQQELPNLRPECLRVLEVSTTLLQRCAAAGLSLADIGAIATRPLDALDGDDSHPSELERACIAARQAVETRELAATLSSSYSSEGTFTLAEEAEEDLLATSEQEESEDEQQQTQQSEEGTATPDEQQRDGSGGSSLSRSPMQLSAGKPPGHQRPRSPSRLGVVPMAAPDDGCGGEEAQQQEQHVTAGAAAAGAMLQQQQAGELCGGSSKAGSGDLASTLSRGTGSGLPTAMSLGSRASRVPGDVDLLFDLDDDSSSSAANTPMGGVSSCGGGRAASPLGRRAMAATAGTPAGAASSDGDVIMGSLRAEGSPSEALSQYLSSVQLMPPPGVPPVAGGDGGQPGSSMGGEASSGASPFAPLASRASLSTPGSSNGAGASLAIARSMHVGGGPTTRDLAFRELRAKGGFGGVLRPASRCCSAAGLKKGSAAETAAAAARRRTGVSRTMYPPPVVRAAPRAANVVLKGLSEAQWQAFMCELRAHMDEALRPGTGEWRRASQAAGLGAAAMSCPRF